MTDRLAASSRLSDLGQRFTASQTAPTVGEVMDAMGPAGLGLVLLVLTLPALIPLPGPFGIAFGLAIALIALQVLLGAIRLWLPAFLRRRTVPQGVLRGIVDYGVPLMRRLEVWLRPRRLLPLTGRLARIGLAIPLIAMAATLALPIPFGNLLPAASLIAFALGFLTRDGYAVLAGLALSLVALAWTGVLVTFGSRIAAWIWALF